MDDLIRLQPEFWEAAGETLYMVSLGLLFGGLGGLILGVTLYVTRPGNFLAQGLVFTIINLIVNFFRPIPFIIFIAAVQPLARIVVGVGIGTNALIFALSLAATFGIARVVEQNLVTIDPGLIEAARAFGSSPIRIIFSVVLREGFGPLVLGFTFVFVALVDMSAMAGLIGGGGLGNFAIVYGYRQYEPVVTWAALLLIIVFVQAVQFFGNWLAKRILRR